MRAHPLMVDEPLNRSGIQDADNFFDQAREIYSERIRAHQKHDDHRQSMERKDYNDPAWLPVVIEEIGEVAKEICESRHNHTVTYKKRLRAELIQVMAMCSAWIDAIDMDRGDTSDS